MSVFHITYIFLGLLCAFGVNGDDQKPITSKDLFTMPSGNLIPYVGFGTFQIKGDDKIFKVLDYALGAGYRLIDSAQLYENEASIGKALKVLLPKYNLTRKDIFITSKLEPLKLGDDVYARIEKSVRDFDTRYLDLYLIHFPALFVRKGSTTTKSDSVLRDETWQTFTKAVKDGLVRNIGVSNYNVRQLNELLKNDHGIKPAVNQVEWHPYYHQPPLLELCKKEGILLQAYGSLGGTNHTEFLLTKPTVVDIAKKLNKTPAQVLLRWALQQKIGIIPKASSEARIKENLDLDFTIPEEDMKTLLSFEQKKLAWDPDKFQ